ncbi:type I-E CRISPR-associated protein Cas5/CasD [Haloglycomyces albus]|uniref:type I-E CRISPR-associated protein Cas5/CasD n=1 Tax=Haloglycomyces albus TaxID=526067 RepID=UPI00046CA037|nr:type I-E CRISPR-associated protein Cas5/CasD [Haloglycomyces albus]
MNGLILRLAGPLQSWGHRSRFNHRDSARYPTRSGLEGLIAACLGQSRGRRPDLLGRLGFTIRIDRAGRVVTDYHTVGGGIRNGQQQPVNPNGKNVANQAETHRTYLSDAAFTVAVQAPDNDLSALREAIDCPIYAPYLGRRSCAPAEPFLLARQTSEPIEDLLQRIPLQQTATHVSSETIDVDFIWEQQPQERISRPVELFDQPSGSGRVMYRNVRWKSTEPLPSSLVTEEPWPEALSDYMEGTQE